MLFSPKRLNNTKTWPCEKKSGERINMVSDIRTLGVCTTKIIKVFFSGNLYLFILSRNDIK